MSIDPNDITICDAIVPQDGIVIEDGSIDLKDCYVDDDYMDEAPDYRNAIAILYCGVAAILLTLLAAHLVARYLPLQPLGE